MNLSEEETKKELVPVIKNDFQFIIGVLFIGVFNYAIFMLFIYSYGKFKYLQTAFGGLLMIIVPMCFVFAVIFEIAVLYGSKQEAKNQNNKEKANGGE